MISTDTDVSREWIRAAGGVLLTTVVTYRDRVRQFCVDELGMQWDTLIRDPEYFAEAMRKAREEKKKRLERLRALIPRRQNWEAPIATPGGQEGDANRFLDELLDEGRDVEIPGRSLLAWVRQRSDFDLQAIEEHILANIGANGTDLRELPPVMTDARLDLVFKFIAAIFLQHTGLVTIHQASPSNLVLCRAGSRGIVEAGT